MAAREHPQPGVLGAAEEAPQLLQLLVRQPHALGRELDVLLGADDQDGRRRPHGQDVGPVAQVRSEPGTWLQRQPLLGLISMLLA